MENITKSRLLRQDGPAEDGPISSILTSDANGDLSSVSTDIQYLLCRGVVSYSVWTVGLESPQLGSEKA